MNVKLLRFIILAVVFLVGGIIFLVMGIKQKSEFNAPRARLETVTAAELHEGLFVEGEIYELWDEFAYTEEYESTLGIKHNEKTTDRFFALPMEYSFYEDAPMFIAVCSRDSAEIAKMNKMSDEANDFYTDGTELKSTMHFVGKIQPLKNEYLDFFKEYVAFQLGVSELEATQYFAPYVIRSWPEDNSSVLIIMGAIFTAIGLAGTIILVVNIVKAKRTGY